MDTQDLMKGVRANKIGYNLPLMGIDREYVRTHVLNSHIKIAMLLATILYRFS